MWHWVMLNTFILTYQIYKTVAKKRFVVFFISFLVCKLWSGIFEHIFADTVHYYCTTTLLHTVKSNSTKKGEETDNLKIINKMFCFLS